MAQNPTKMTQGEVVKFYQLARQLGVNDANKAFDKLGLSPSDSTEMKKRWPLIHKIASQCTEKQFVAYYVDGIQPPLKLSTQEMQAVSGGGVWEILNPVPHIIAGFVNWATEIIIGVTDYTNFVAWQTQLINMKPIP